jgi:HAD superfamily hydrolase (TIGR01459 family)
MQIIDRLAEVSSGYRALFVDLWGTVHDGVRVLPGVNEALMRFRADGGRVILITNSPRPRDGVARQIEPMGVDPDAWDDIATSGDSARMAMYQGAVGSRVFHIGQTAEDGTPVEEGFFVPPKVLDDPVAIERVPIAEAEGVVCTSPFKSGGDLAMHRPDLLLAKTRGLKLLCANPDVVVDRGGTREWCAGAVAELYEQMGGESLYFGKPHPPIYDLARRRLARFAEVPDADILAIGDGPATDARGAMGEDLDLLFVTGGLGAEETGTTPERGPDPGKLRSYLEEHGLEPRFVMPFFR